MPIHDQGYRRYGGGKARGQVLSLALHGRHVTVQETGKFAGMRRENDGSGAVFQMLGVMLQGVEAVGIQDHGDPDLGENRADQSRDCRALPQPRSECEHVIRLRQGKELVFCPVRQQAAFVFR